MGGWGAMGAPAPSGLWVLRVPGDPLLPGGCRVGQEGRATLGWREAGSTVKAKCQRGATGTLHTTPETNF